MNGIPIVVGLGFGDEGKGSIVDALVRKTNAHVVVRFNGGAQAAHNVITPDGKHHTFSQFGSGTLAGAKTFLSQFMMIDPLAMEREALHLAHLGIEGDPMSTVYVDGEAPIITVYHRCMNRIREIARGENRHGSCGVGIGELMRDVLDSPETVLRAKDLRDVKLTFEKLTAIRDMKRLEAESFSYDIRNAALMDAVMELVDSYSPGIMCQRLFNAAGRWVKIEDGAQFLRTISANGSIVFEGAQGVLLDEWAGFHPYTTYSTCTFANAIALLREATISTHIVKVGVTRSYSTRHGAGPFPSEDTSLLEGIEEPHNGTNPWQCSFRKGPLDLILLKYAIDVCAGIDQLAVSHLDWTHFSWPLCRQYRIEGEPAFRVNALLCGLSLRDLPYQKRLTELLQKVNPVFSFVVGSGRLIEVLEDELATPVGIKSYGPRAVDKEFIQSAIVI